MPVFCPPVVQDWPQVLEYDPEKRANPLGYRLMSPGATSPVS